MSARSPLPEAGPGTENLAGLVERVTFHNPDNGFCVLRLKAGGQREPVTVVGHAALIAAGAASWCKLPWVGKTSCIAGLVEPGSSYNGYARGPPEAEAVDGTLRH